MFNLLEFKRESYKFILNNCGGFTEMTLYRSFNDLALNYKFLLMIYASLAHL